MVKNKEINKKKHKRDYKESKIPLTG
jgi:hypothetical protein